LNSTGTVTTPVLDFTTTFNVGTSCSDVQAHQGATQSGIYLIQPPNLYQGPWKIYCDLETDGGYWTVFQTRDDVEPHENFMRNWDDYKVGFGAFDREFWLGNSLLWALTNIDNYTQYELAIDMEDWSGNKRFARYSSFKMGPETDKFRLYYQNMYFGNAGDSLYSHNGLPFSTFDVDNDNRDGDFAERSCARLYKGGWWYGNCHDSNLNGWYLGGPHRSFADGVNWYTWTGYNYSLRRTSMRFRPQAKTPTTGYPPQNSYSPPQNSYSAPYSPPSPATSYQQPNPSFSSPQQQPTETDSYLAALALKNSGHLHKHGRSEMEAENTQHEKVQRDSD
jgi:ficolin